MHKCLLFIATIAVVAFGCTGGKESGNVIARPTAYPRIEIYDSVYCANDLPAGFEVNSSAIVSDVTPADKNGPADPRWIDILYPRYGATLHCTFIPVDSTGNKRNELLANRNERMMLNLGDNFAEQTELRSADGGETLILTTMGKTLTPVQFLSTTPRWVISGGLQFHDPEIKADSVAPIINAVRSDLIHAGRNLKTSAP